MTYGKWIPWIPFEQAGKTVFISKFNHTLDNLVIELTEDDEKRFIIRVTFPNRELIGKLEVPIL